MSLLDVDLSEDKLDYDVIYKKKFDRLEVIITDLCSNIAVENTERKKLREEFDYARDMVIKVMDENYKLKQNLINFFHHWNDIYPEHAIYYDNN